MTQCSLVFYLWHFRSLEFVPHFRRYEKKNSFKRTKIIFYPSSWRHWKWQSSLKYVFSICKLGNKIWFTEFGGFLEIVCRFHIYSVNTTYSNCFIFWLHGVNEIFQVPVRIRVSNVAVRAKTVHFLAFASVLIARHWCVLSSYPASELVSSYL